MDQGRAGKGRPKGSKNKLPAAVKDMILQALTNVGGVQYLEEQARKNPGPFLSLIGRVLPLSLTGTDDGPVQTVVQHIYESGAPARD